MLIFPLNNTPMIRNEIIQRVDSKYFPLTLRNMAGTNAARIKQMIFISILFEYITVYFGSKGESISLESYQTLTINKKVDMSTPKIEMRFVTFHLAELFFICFFFILIYYCM